jgi:rhodanese-related sulfurtransferase
MSQTETTWRGKTFKGLVQDAKSRIQEIQAEDLRTWQAEGKNIVILDVREPEDYEQGHILGAINIPRGLLELEIDELVPDQDKVVVV